MSVPFDKTYVPSEDIVSLLKNRGLTIDDPRQSKHYIRNIGYVERKMNLSHRMDKILSSNHPDVRPI